MASVIKKNIYDMALISTIKSRTGPKKLKKIIKNLRNLVEDDIKKLSGFKIKIFEEKEEQIKQEFKIIAPIFRFQHYFEDSKKSISKSIVNNDNDLESDKTSSSVNNNEEETKQKDSSDFSSDD